MAKESKAVNLTNLYSELSQQGSNGEYDRALKTANKILQVAHSDKSTYHCKVVCLIQLGKFPDVLKHISQNQELLEGLTFEKAYSLYRLNRTDEALEVLRSVASLDEREKELLAQVLYRKEEYEEAYSIYKDVIKNTQDDYEEERNTNLSAVMAALQMWDKQEVDEVAFEEETYELAYNAACGYLGHSKYKEALDKLKAAEALCRQMFEDDPEISQEEVEAELGDIRVQIGYVLQQLGKNDEALKYYNMVVKSRPTDIALTAVASNNIITLNKDLNVFDSQKRIKALQADGLQQKLTRLQRQALTLNQSLFYLIQNKNELCRKSLQLLKAEEGDSDLPAMIEAALYSKEKQQEKAVEILQEEYKRCESLQIGLALVQMHLNQGQVYKACDALKEMGQDSLKMGVISALVMLYLSQEDYDAASDVLLDTIAVYKKEMPDSPHVPGLMRANANLQLKRGNAKGATEMLEDLKKRNPGDLKTLAQLISAYSKFDPKKAQLVSRELPLPSDLSKTMDVDSLENAANLGPRYNKRAAKTELSPGSPKSEDDELLQRKKKKKKKVKLPKNYDPQATVDAERWLPLRERSYYRGKRKKKQGIGKGTQGAMSAATTAEFDKSLPAPSASTAPGAAEGAAGSASPVAGGSTGPASGPTTPGTGPRQQKPQGGKPQRKKKKGGAKW